MCLSLSQLLRLPNSPFFSELIRDKNVQRVKGNSCCRNVSKVTPYPIRPLASFPKINLRPLRDTGRSFLYPLDLSPDDFPEPTTSRCRKSGGKKRGRETTVASDCHCALSGAMRCRQLRFEPLVPPKWKRKSGLPTLFSFATELHTRTRSFPFFFPD